MVSTSMNRFERAGGGRVSHVTDGLEKVNETDSKSLGHMVGGAVIIFLLVI